MGARHFRGACSAVQWYCAPAMGELRLCQRVAEFQPGHTYIDAISAIEAATTKVPSVAMMKPYTTETGPPLVYAPAKSAEVASHVHSVQQDMARTAQKFHSRCQPSSARSLTRLMCFLTFNTCFLPAASRAAVSDSYTAFDMMCDTRWRG